MLRFTVRLTGFVAILLISSAGAAVGQTLVPQTNWTLHSVDSQETAGGNYAATNAFDGNTSTMWTSQWQGASPPLPHDIRVNLGSAYAVSGFRYLPRQDGSTVGRIGQYEFYVSTDGTNWGAAVMTGTFANTAAEQQVTFTAKTGQYVRLRALSEVSGWPYTAVAELNVLSTGGTGNQPPNGVITAPASNVTITPGQSVTFNGSGTDPEGDAVSYAWSFPGGNPSSSTAQNPPAVVYATAGVYTATLTVTAGGAPDPTPATRTVTVQGGGSPGTPIPQTNWTLHFVDSQETAGGNYGATNAFDGNPSTMWTSQWQGASPPPPHDIRINLGSAYAVSGFRYLPRQDGSTVGRIGQYQFYVSTDGTNWGTAVVTGTFPDTATEQQLVFTAKTGQYVRLRALSEVAGRPYTAVAELNVLSTGGTGNQPPNGVITAPASNVTITPGQSVTFNGSGTDPEGDAVSYAWSFPGGNPSSSTAQNPPAVVYATAGVYTATLTVTAGGAPDPTPATRTVTVQGGGSPGTPIPQTNWTLHFVDSQETAGGNYGATNAFDGNPSTMWTSQWQGASPPPPHDIRINLGSAYAVSGFRYLPRQDGSTVGRIGQYEFYVSTDGTNWGTAVVTGTFPDTATEQQLVFTAKTGQYVRLRALSEVAGRPYTAVAELNVLSTGGTGNQPPNGVITAPASNVTITPGQSVTFNGSGTDPEGDAVSYAWSFPGGSPSSSTAQNPPAVVYATAGAYTAALTVRDSQGLADPTPATRTITVQSASSSGVTPISQSGWTLRYADSVEFSDLDGSATNAFDGNPGTSWVTEYTNGGPGLPHEIQIDLHGTYDIAGLRYLPHQAFQAGRVGDYELYVSSDGNTWASPVAAGAFPDTNSGAAREIRFPAVTGRYIRFRALSEANGIYQITAIGELNVLRAGTGPNQPPSLTMSSPAGNLTVVVGSALSLNGSASDADGPQPLSYQWRVGGGAGITDLAAAQPGVVQFAKVGTFPVTFTAADAYGKAASITRTVTVTSACQGSSVVLTQPRSHYLQAGTNFVLAANVCGNISGQGVRFVVDGVSAPIDYSAPYSVGVSLGRAEHLVEAFLVDSSGNQISGNATYDQAIGVGRGDYYVAIGDGMTTGFGDTKADDDNSADGRNMAGGFTPILGDLLTTARGYPVFVANEGVSGAASQIGVDTIQTLLQKHSNSQYFLIMYGHNDAEDGVPSGLGLKPTDAGYAGSFKDKIQRIISAVRAAGKFAILSEAPPILPLNSQWDLAVQQYNQVMAELAADPANAVPVTPPHMYSYFQQHPEEYNGPILMDGVGYLSMAQIWSQALN